MVSALLTDYALQGIYVSWQRASHAALWRERTPFTWIEIDSRGVLYRRTEKGNLINVDREKRRKL